MLVVLALAVATVSGKICDGQSAASAADFATIKNTVLAVSSVVMANCNLDSGAEFSSLLETDSCIKIFSEGYCYYDNAAVLYAAVPVSYGVLNSDVANIASLGNTLCAEAEACYAPIRDAVRKCVADDATFLPNVIESATLYYKSAVEARVESYATANSDTIVGTLIDIAMKRFTSFNDINAFFLEQTAGTGIADDATAAVASLKEVASLFCSSGCTDQTASFLNAIFGYMDKSSNCNDAGVFCGGCQAKAAKFLKSKGSIPCCLVDVADYAIAGGEAVYAKYGDQIENVREYLGAEFASKPKLIAIIEEIRDNALAQMACLEKVYDAAGSCA